MEYKQLLIDFFLYFRNNGNRLIGLTIEQMVDEYLKSIK